MRLPSDGFRARRAAEVSEPEPEEGTEPAHHEHSRTEHHEHHEHSHPEHHPGHDYNNMKEKFMNELGHLPSEPHRNWTEIIYLFLESLDIQPSKFLLIWIYERINKDAVILTRKSVSFFSQFHLSCIHTTGPSVPNQIFL